MSNLLRRAGLGAWLSFLGGSVALAGGVADHKYIVYLGGAFALCGAFIAALQQAMAQKEVADVNREMKSFMMGDDSFCYMSVGNLNLDPNPMNKATFGFVHCGDYPLRNPYANIIDLEKTEKILSQLPRPGLSLDQGTIPISLPTMSAGRYYEIGSFDIGKGNTISFNIDFSSLTSEFLQQLRLKRIDGNWVLATRVERMGDIIHEQIDDNYPRNDEDGVDWE